MSEYEGVNPGILEIHETLRGANMAWDGPDSSSSTELIRQEIKFPNKVDDYAIFGSVVSTFGAVGLAIKRVIETGDGLSLIHQSFFVLIPTSIVAGVLAGGTSFALVSKGIEMVKDLRRRVQDSPKV